MRQQQSTAAFQLRTEDGKYLVYLLRVNGREIPRDRQRAVYGPETATRAQLVCDALNRGLLTKITLAIQGAVKDQEKA
ncbi:MAG TPA: hypothetical protein VGG75_37925 [Trebonia sp.]|jgi:hypothetical protein